MKFHRIVLYFLILFTCLASAGTKKKSLRTLAIRTAKTKIVNILNSPDLRSSFTGMEVMDLKTRTVIFERNSEKLFHPASNTKLLTTAAALATIPNYIYKTALGTDGSIHDSTLQGNLYIRGSGDPLFRVEHMDSLAGNLAKKGLTRITGDLIGDPSYFDSVAWGTGWMWDDEPSSDEPFITPLAVNGNSVHVTIEPGASPGLKPSYNIFPFTPALPVIDSGMTGFDTSNTPLLATRRHGENEIRIAGWIAPHTPPKEFDISVGKPEVFFLDLFRERLLAHGVIVAGKNRLGQYAGTALLGTVNHELDSAITLINKFSDNPGAEGLVKTMGAELCGHPGSWQNGMFVIKRYLFSVGIDTAAIILNDGSGVSFYNIITPADMVMLLADQYYNPARFKRFSASLPIAGVDGTLHNRMRGSPAAKNVHAKTGTITGVSALSGYVTSADGRLLAFSIMSNHFPGDVKILRDVQDHILEALAITRIGQ